MYKYIPIILRNYSSGFVLIKETTRSPFFHCPRLRSNSTRSKRLSTFLFLDSPPGGLKLGCLLIVKFNIGICVLFQVRKKFMQLHLLDLPQVRQGLVFSLLDHLLVLMNPRSLFHQNSFQRIWLFQK